MPEIIDLDATDPRDGEPDRGFLGYWWRRLTTYRVRVLVLIVVFLLGAAAGHYVTRQRDRVDPGPALTVLKNPAFTGSEPHGRVWLMDATILVANTGTAGTVVHRVTAEGPGVRMITDLETVQPLEPGQTMTIEVSVAFDCDRGPAVRMPTRVLTGAGEIEPAVDLVANAWVDDFAALCTQSG